MDRRLELEILIDRMGLYELLCEVVEIAHQKADHLEHNWQDYGAARSWRRAAKRIELAAAGIRGTV